MRIIAGRFKRRSLSSPRNSETRPSTDQTREALFNLLTNRIDLYDSKVLDLFSGTGALGLEAISRGASEVTFVDSSRDALSISRANAEALDPDLNVEFVLSDVFLWLNRPSSKSYRLILADPPYAVPDIDRLPDRILPFLDDEGVFVLEHDRKVHMDQHPRCVLSRRYGRSVISIFIRPSS